MNIQPYLSFDGRCEEAIEFYKSAVGAKVEFMMRNKESPEQAPPGTIPAGNENKIMHVAFRIGDSTVMASDGYCKGNPEFKGIMLSIQADNATDAERMFAALAAGGKVLMPLGKTFWSPCFGMLADRFGVSWMVNVAV